MKVKIITWANLGNCKQKRWDPAHFMDEHKIEECDPILKNMVETKAIELQAEYKAKQAKLKAAQEQKLTNYKQKLRNSKRPRFASS